MLTLEGFIRIDRTSLTPGKMHSHPSFKHLAEPPIALGYSVRKNHEISKCSRGTRKLDLMAAFPYCTICGVKLTTQVHRANSSCLCNNHLYCPAHVNLVRQGRQKREQAVTTEKNLSKALGDIRVSLTPKGKSCLQNEARKRARTQQVQRRNSKLELMQIDPTCSHCKRIVVFQRDRDDSASLVIDRLSCPACIRIVRDCAFADSPNALITESKTAVLPPV